MLLLTKSFCLNIPYVVITVLDMNKRFDTISRPVNMVVVTLAFSLIIMVASPCPEMFITSFVAVAACFIMGSVTSVVAKPSSDAKSLFMMQMSAP